MLPDLSRYEKHVELTNGRVRYYEMGSGDHHVILLHGMGIVTSADTWQFVIEDFAKHFHVYAPDAFGFGKSPRQMEYGPTMDIIVDGLREFMDVLGLKKVDLVGSSAGGWWGLQLAYESPDRLRKVVSLGGAGLNVTPSGGPEGSIARRTVEMPTKEGLMRGISRSFFQGSHMTPELGAAMAEQMLGYAKMPGGLTSLNPLVEQMGNPASRKHYMLHRRLPYIKVPCMIIWGKGGPNPHKAAWPQAGQGDTMEPYPTWTAEWDHIKGDISKSSKPWVIPGAKYVMTEGGHNLHWEKPKEFVQMVTEFLLS